MVGERPWPVPYRVEPAAVEGILDPPNGFRIVISEETLPDGRQEAVTDSRGDNVGEEQRRQDGRAEGLDNLQSSCQERVTTFAGSAESQVHECVGQCQDRQEHGGCRHVRRDREGEAGRDDMLVANAFKSATHQPSEQGDQGNPRTLLLL